MALLGKMRSPEKALVELQNQLAMYDRIRELYNVGFERERSKIEFEIRILERQIHRTKSAGRSRHRAS